MALKRQYSKHSSYSILLLQPGCRCWWRCGCGCGGPQNSRCHLVCTIFDAQLQYSTHSCDNILKNKYNPSIPAMLYCCVRHLVCCAQYSTYSSLKDEMQVQQPQKTRCLSVHNILSVCIPLFFLPVQLHKTFDQFGSKRDERARARERKRECRRCCTCLVAASSLDAMLTCGLR